MTAYEQACALAAHVGADLASRGKVLGVKMPTAAAVQAVLGVADHRRDDVRREVHDLYLDVRDRLAGSDPCAAVGFGIGRMLGRYDPSADDW